MRLTVLGCAASFPDPGVATSSYLIEHDETSVLLDCGHGAVAQLRLAVELGKLSAIVISHMHPDHFFDLIALRNCWYRQNLTPIPLYLPPDASGTLARLLDAIDFPHDYMTDWFDVIEHDRRSQFRIGSLDIWTADARHHIETSMLRARSADGMTVGFTADTGWFEELPAFFNGSDLLLAEATNYPNAEAEAARFHLSPEECGRLFRSAGAGLGVVTHYEGLHDRQILEIASATAGSVPVELAVAGGAFSLSA